MPVEHDDYRDRRTYASAEIALDQQFVPSEGGWRVVPVDTSGPGETYAFLRDEKAANTGGGSFATGAWRTRDLNTLDDPGEFVLLEDNRFTLVYEGVYDIYATAPAYAVGRHKAKLKDITNDADLLIGSSAYSFNDASAGGPSVVQGRLTVEAMTVLELQHQCQITDANGFGIASNFGVVEVYSEVRIQRFV